MRWRSSRSTPRAGTQSRTRPHVPRPEGRLGQLPELATPLALCGRPRPRRSVPDAIAATRRSHGCHYEGRTATNYPSGKTFDFVGGQPDLRRPATIISDMDGSRAKMKVGSRGAFCPPEIAAAAARWARTFPRIRAGLHDGDAELPGVSASCDAPRGASRPWRRCAEGRGGGRGRHVGIRRGAEHVVIVRQAQMLAPGAYGGVVQRAVLSTHGARGRAIFPPFW